MAELPSLKQKAKTKLLYLSIWVVTLCLNGTSSRARANSVEKNV